MLENAAEIERGIDLAEQYANVVAAINVGNEALVEWNDHMVPLDRSSTTCARSGGRGPAGDGRRQLRVVDQDGAPLAAEVDFIGVHTYPAWEEKTIDEGLSYTIENLARVRAALPGQTDRSARGGMGNRGVRVRRPCREAEQARYYRELAIWATTQHVPCSSSKHSTNRGKATRRTWRAPRNTGDCSTSTGPQSRSCSADVP